MGRFAWVIYVYIDRQRECDSGKRRGESSIRLTSLGQAGTLVTAVTATKRAGDPLNLEYNNITI